MDNKKITGECCGRPMQYSTEQKCNYNDCCMGEYCGCKLGRIKEMDPTCDSTAVIPSVTVQSIDGITNLANCLVHVEDTNTTYYVDDKHRIMITWAGPVDIPGYDMETNPNKYKDQIVTDIEKGVAVIYDKHGNGYMFGITQDSLQEAVDKKLDEMAEDGTLEEIILTYMDDVAHVFDAVADMKASTDLEDGDYATTLGYYGRKDGGGATYKIRELQSGETVDEKTLIGLGHDNLVAEINIGDNLVSVKQFGAYGDDTHDDTNAFNAAISYVTSHYGKLYMDRGTYKLTSKITLNWDSGNFNLGFNQSFELFGAGQLETKLHFTSSNGLDINPSNNGLVIKVHDFCIENSDYNNLEDTGNVRTPDLTHGVGLKVKHIGYMGRVSNIAVRGFYVGIMSTNCYGGPIFENLFVKNTVFGYYSTGDTTIEHNSCSYVGCECGYLQDGSMSTLTNVIVESNIHWFVDDNSYGQRSKFEGRGFSFIGGANVVTDSCYCEDLYGNAVYVEDSSLNDRNSSFNNLMNYHLTTPAYSDLATWLSNNPGHNYDDFYISNSQQAIYSVKIDSSAIVGTSSAYVDIKRASSDADYLDHTDSVIFANVRTGGTWVNNFNRFYHGNTKPIVIIDNNYEANNSNIGYMPKETYGIPLFKSNYNPSNFGGPIMLSTSRSATYSDTTYDEVKLSIKHATDGSIRFYRETILNGTTVANTEVIRIGADNKVTFPQN